MIEPPTFDAERELYAQGYRQIAGIDEVGRGTLAGPVVAAAVILPLESDITWLTVVRDSKQLTSRRREYLLRQMQKTDIPMGIGVVSHTDIDSRGIVKATRLAMGRAIDQLPIPPDALLIDAMTLPEVNLTQKGIIHGDRLSLSIACASIVAKVNRDHYMVEMDSLYPGYGLAKHKGYGTKQHLACLQELGPCPIHRRSFAPVRRLIEKQSI